MPAIRHLLAGFFGGELDPLMSGRVDTDQHRFGLATCENFVCINEGPIVKRPGFQYVQDAGATSAWLGAFRYNVTQEYVIEWGNLAARFFTNGLPIESAPNVPYEIAHPYLAAEVPALSVQQSFDRLYIDHPLHPPASLARLDAVTFQHQVSQLINGPFADQNTNEAVTVTVSATTGAGITITATAPIFVAGHVGELFRIEAKDFSDIKAWNPGMKDITVGYLVRSEGKAYQASNAGTTGTQTPIHVEGSEWDGINQKDVNDKGPYGISWTFLHDKFGIARITAIGGGGTTATADVVRRLPSSLVTVPSYKWSHSAFSNAAGWPSLVAHWMGRQIHIKDFDIVASVAGDFGGGRVNFQAFTSTLRLAPDLAFRRTIATDNPPLWIAADRRLVVGCAVQELALGPINSQQSLSGDNVQAEPQSFYGSEPVAPVQVGTEIFFVERGGRRLRAADYDFARDRYAAPDLTAASRHVTASGIVQLAYERVPYTLLHAVRRDGQIAVHANTRIEVKGFTRTVLGGGAKCISAVSIVGEDGRTDELWLLVERTRHDGVRREIWRQAPWREPGDAQDQAFFVDAGVMLPGAASQTVFPGLAHLAGQPVAVLCNGGVVPEMAVDAGGTLTLPATSVPPFPFTLVVGLQFTALAVTLPPEEAVNKGTMQGLIQRVVKATVRLLETVGLRAGPPEGPFEETIERRGGSTMDAPIPLFTGDTGGAIDAQHTRAGQVAFLSDRPVPAIITAAMLKIDVDANDA